MKIAILGAGMVGSTIAKDLAKNFSVTSIDINDKNLRKLNKFGVDSLLYNLKHLKGYNKLLKPFDLIVSAVPGFMGYKTLEAIIMAGKNVVDISFFPEDASSLNKLAKAKKVTAVIDCGVAPGMSNIILGRYNEEYDLKSFSCMVGGLPKKRELPFEYKAPFSPIDVIEEYSRTARLVKDGKVVDMPALSEITLESFEETGTLESFNTDGLRSLLKTMAHIPNMKEKTLRYPGHAQYMLDLFKAGFFSTNKIKINNTEISPLEFTSQILFEQWKLAPDEEEFTLMHNEMEGNDKITGKPVKITYHLYDSFNTADKISSMSRCTGYTCNAAVNLLANKYFNRRGVFPPEIIGANKKCFDYIINYLKERNVNYVKTQD